MWNIGAREAASCKRECGRRQCCTVMMIAAQARVSRELLAPRPPAASAYLPLRATACRLVQRCPMIAMIGDKLHANSEREQGAVPHLWFACLPFLLPDRPPLCDPLCSRRLSRSPGPWIEQEQPPSSPNQTCL